MAKRFDRHQINALNLSFQESNRPTKEKKIELASATGLDMEQITSWFNRTRADQRARVTIENLKTRNAELQQALQDRRERELKLEQELEECKRREADLAAEIHHLKQQLEIVHPGSDPLLRFINGYP